MTAPLLLLDVDGVLNAFGYAGESPDDRDWSFGTAEADGSEWPITWCPSVLAQLRAWHEQGVVELQWLTTWGHEANGQLRELLGLPELAVAGTYEEDDVLITGAPSRGASAAHAAVAPAAPDPLSGKWWKYDVVRRIVAAQPLRRVIWVDDELDEADSPFVQWAAETGGQVVTVGPGSSFGLGDTDLTRIGKIAEGCE